MRKIIVSMNVTLDGFMAGPNCELDWHFSYWNDEMAKYAIEQLSVADTILLGRVTYKAMAKYWPAKAMDLSYPREDIAFAGMMNSYAKIVFSKTMNQAPWNNSKLIKNDIGKEIVKLKQRPGKNMIIFGSGSIVTMLMELDLIDEYVLWVHPVFIGKGKSLFRNLEDKLTLKLIKAKTFTTGVVVLYYESINTFDHCKISNMEKSVLNDDIKTFYVEAPSFPAGIMDAWQKLQALLPSLQGRKFYGISYGNENGDIIYKAAAEESYPGEAEKYGCSTFIIPHGSYYSIFLSDWKKDETEIGRSFQKMIAQPGIDKQGFCLEMYLDENQIRCMVRAQS